jgi:hypothetical protein
MANKKIKAVYFNLDYEQDLRDYADTLPNFSQFVKEKLLEDKQLKEQNALHKPSLENTQELISLVQQLVKKELVSHIVTDQAGNLLENLDMNQFF